MTLRVLTGVRRPEAMLYTAQFLSVTGFWYSQEGTVVALVMTLFLPCRGFLVLWEFNVPLLVGKS